MYRMVSKLICKNLDFDFRIVFFIMLRLSRHPLVYKIKTNLALQLFNFILIVNKNYEQEGSIKIYNSKCRGKTFFVNIPVNFVLFSKRTYKVKENYSQICKYIFLNLGESSDPHPLSLSLSKPQRSVVPLFNLANANAK